MTNGRPAEDVFSDVQLESIEVLPVRAGDPEVAAVPLEAEEVQSTNTELAKVRDHLMTH